MSLDMAPDQPYTLEQWSVWFKEHLAPADLDSAGVLAFMFHFADMGILEPADQNRWKLCDLAVNPSSGQLRDAVRNHLEGVSRTEAGFAIAYFLGKQPIRSPKTPQTQKPPTTSDASGDVQAPNREKASDLSNLQIVKKVGRQLRPFLDFERDTLTRLEGTYIQPQDARLIFNFILRQTQQKAEPKKWEQLSRKRHK
jgi:hypothetical protein